MISPGLRWLEEAYRGLKGRRPIRPLTPEELVILSQVREHHLYSADELHRELRNLWISCTLLFGAILLLAWICLKH